jgi:hypothetical protein
MKLQQGLIHNNSSEQRKIHDPFYVDLGMGYIVACKESDQYPAYIILHNFNKLWIHEFLYRDILRK